MMNKEAIDNILLNNFMICPSAPIGTEVSVVFNAVNPALDKVAAKRIFAHNPVQLQAELAGVIELQSPNLLIP